MISPARKAQADYPGYNPQQSEEVNTALEPLQDRVPIDRLMPYQFERSIVPKV